MVTEAAWGGVEATAAGPGPTEAARDAAGAADEGTQGTDEEGQGWGAAGAREGPRTDRQRQVSIQAMLALLSYLLLLCVRCA